KWPPVIAQMPTRLALTMTNAAKCEARSRLASVRLRAPALTSLRPGGSTMMLMLLHPITLIRPSRCGMKRKRDRVFGPCWLTSQPGDADDGGGGDGDRDLGLRRGADPRSLGHCTGRLLVDRQVRDRA